MGGQYYEDFIQNGFVAIGYDQVNLSDIAAANTKNDLLLTKLSMQSSNSLLRTSMVIH